MYKYLLTWIMKINYQKVLQFLIYGGCLIGFVWIIFGELTKYFDKVTSTSTSYLSGARNFPDIIFCNSNGMKDGVTDQEVITFSKDSYDKNARPIDINIREVYGKNCFFHYPTRAIITRGLYILTSIFTVVYIVEGSVLQTIYVLNK